MTADNMTADKRNDNENETGQEPAEEEPRIRENKNDLKICPRCNERINKDLKECPNCHSLLFFDKKTAEQRIEKIKNYNWGQILLREREYIFEKIYQEEDLNSQIKFFAIYSLLFSFTYGIAVGMYSGYWQIISSGIKVPLMLFGTLTVCLPALFTFNILLGSKLSFRQTLSTLLISTYLISIIMVSFAPILLFFTFSTNNHSFFSLINLLFCIISGGFGINILWKCLHFLTIKSGYDPNFVIIKIWTVIYMFVGTQFAWLLRPFIGDRGNFILFRPIEGNFYIYVLQVIKGFF